MGLMQAAYRTYKSQKDRVGVMEAGREPLTPISHMIAKAHIEIALSPDGAFQSARAVAKEESRVIIPVTEESGNRTGDNDKAHPLCDQLRYLAAYGGSKNEVYLRHLLAWTRSPYTHPKAEAVLRYVQGGTILADLAAAGVIKLDDRGLPGAGRIEGTEYEKCMVRWRILGGSEEESTACWEDSSLFQSFIGFYESLQADRARVLCELSGRQDAAALFHPKGTVAINYGAKLVSYNNNGFTYRGRFTKEEEAGSVGYTASQMAHNALHWLAANDGVIIGGRTFLWWNPEGKPMPPFGAFGLPPEEKQSFVSYKQYLLETLSGYKLNLKMEDKVVVTALDAATTGRLSATYFGQFGAWDFLDRLEHWYETCCWESAFNGVQSPSIRRIAQFAFGTQRETFVEADDRVLREHVQQLLHCVVDKQPLPRDIVLALAQRASTPLAYKPGNREILLCTACAVIRKFRNDRKGKEEWTLALDENNTNRSYLYGRLLAIAEKIERDTYSKDESREPNAIRMQSMFANRPFDTWRRLEERLNPYFRKLKPGLRMYYRGMIGEIVESMSETDRTLNNKLDDTYLLGYYHQRTALYTKKNNETDNTTMMEEDNDESAQE